MDFTKDMSDRLHELFKKKAELIVQELFGCALPLGVVDSAWRADLREEWHSWLEGLGVKRISRATATVADCNACASLLRGSGSHCDVDADRFKGMLIIDNPGSWSRRPGYLLVPKEVAEKLLVLGVA